MIGVNYKATLKDNTVVEMAGIFSDEAHFERFAHQEVQRNCYKGNPFVTVRVVHLSDEEYRRYQTALNAKLKET